MDVNLGKDLGTICFEELMDDWWIASTTLTSLRTAKKTTIWINLCHLLSRYRQHVTIDGGLHSSIHMHVYIHVHIHTETSCIHVTLSGQHVLPLVSDARTMLSWSACCSSAISLWVGPPRRVYQKVTKKARPSWLKMIIPFIGRVFSPDDPNFTHGSLAGKDSVQHVAESRLPSMMQDWISWSSKAVEVFSFAEVCHLGRSQLQKAPRILFFSGLHCLQALRLLLICMIAYFLAPQVQCKNTSDSLGLQFFALHN